MSNKVLLIFILSLVGILNLSAQNGQFVLKGEIVDDFPDKSYVYLKALNEDKSNVVNIDTTVVIGQKFEFKGAVPKEPTIYFVVIPDIKEGGLQVVFSPESGVIPMTINKRGTIGGTPRNKEIQSFMNLQYSLLDELNKAYVRLSSGSEQPKEEDFRAEMNKFSQKMGQGAYGIINNNVKNDVGEFFLLSLYEVLPGEQVVELVSKTRPDFQNSDAGKRLANYFEYQNIREGKGKYKDLKLQDPDGRDVALSNYVGKNKYVLFDFWASWCGPCVKEIPHLVEVYGKYKNKGLEIVGISIDDNRQAWTSAIHRRNMTWVHMSDLKGWNSLACETYGVRSIPFTLLVDGEGNIVASNLRGEELANKIAELLD